MDKKLFGVNAPMHTEYAPPERKTLEEILEENQELLDIPMLREILNQLPHLLMVLNKERQLVFSNPALYQLLGLHDYEEILGFRPGEIFDCTNAWLNEAGCGTGPKCQYCGALNALLTAQRTHRPAAQECRMNTLVNEKSITRFLKIQVNPYRTRDSEYYLFYVEDISGSKEKEFLEKTFFHDTNNLFTLLLFSLEDFPYDGLSQEQKTKIQDLGNLTDLIIDQFRTQQDMNRVLNKKFPHHNSSFNSIQILTDSIHLIELRIGHQKMAIIQDPRTSNLTISNDRAILQRVMLNILKNAYEACKKTDEVKIGCKQQEENVIFWVHTPTEIPDAVQARLFEFGTSTKGLGHGIGLYSAKLFTENILGGKITFESSTKEGTTFYVTIPLSLPENV